MLLVPMSSDQVDLLRADGEQSAGSDPTTQRILDAALHEFVSFGLKRATLHSISRRARVGRMTLHRRFATKQLMIEAIVGQEIGRIWAGVGVVFTAHDTLVEQLAEGLAYGIRRAVEHPLFDRLLETDQDAVLPSLTVAAEPLMRYATSFVADHIRASSTAESALDPDRAAETIVRICHSILLTPLGPQDLTDAGALVAYLRAALAPIVGT